jgi:hypothetical protein
MVAFIGESISALGERDHLRKMRPLREDLPPSEHPSAVAAVKLPREAQEDAQLFLGAFSDQSSRVDKFATWTLAVVGGSATLFVSNLDSVTAEVSRYYAFPWWMKGKIVKRLVKVLPRPVVQQQIKCPLDRLADRTHGHAGFMLHRFYFPDGLGDTELR